MLNFAQIESGKMKIHKEQIQIAQLLQDVVEELTFEAQQKNLELKSKISSEPSMFINDPKLVRIILTNLVVNAIKYTEKGSVLVTIDATNGTCQFTVKDTGQGILSDKFEKVFEPFYQGESLGHKMTPGVGLGLTLVKEIVTALGGTIKMESNPGTGSVFHVALPSL